jgi:hypothetical protein
MILCIGAMEAMISIPYTICQFGLGYLHIKGYLTNILRKIPKWKGSKINPQNQVILA